MAVIAIAFVVVMVFGKGPAAPLPAPPTPPTVIGRTFVVHAADTDGSPVIGWHRQWLEVPTDRFGGARPERINDRNYHVQGRRGVIEAMHLDSYCVRFDGLRMDQPQCLYVKKALGVVQTPAPMNHD